MTKFRIRLAKDDDLEEVHKLDRQLLGDSEKPSDDTVFYVAELVQPWHTGTRLDREIVAYGGMRFPPEFPGTAFLSRAGVLEVARGAGLQRRLINARVRHARRDPQCTHVMTYTAIYNAASANSLIGAGFRLYRPETGDLWMGADWNYWRKAIR